MNTTVYLAPRPRSIAPLTLRQGAPGQDLLPRAATAPHEPHAVMLRGLGPERGLGPLQPTLVARTEDDFVAAVQAVLAEPGGATRLADAMALLPRDAGGHFKFYPPVQRVHQLVLVEACCAQPGFPRVDPRRIESAGMVLRRPQVDGSGAAPGWLAWQRRGEQAVGWVALSGRSGAHGVGELDEPDAVRRRPVELSGNSHIDARLQELVRRNSLSAVANTPPSERIIPLHPLPEALCAALGRTVLLGYLPVASDEVVSSAESTRGVPDNADVQALQAHLMHYLRAGPAKALPRAGQPLEPSWIQDIAQAPDGTGDVPGNLAASRWMQTLMQLHLEFDLASSEPEAAGLQQVFAGYRTLRLSADARSAAAGAADIWAQALCRASTGWQAAQGAQLVANVLDVRFRTPVVRALLSSWFDHGRPPLDPGNLSAAEAELRVLRRIRRFLAGTTLEPALSYVRSALDVLLGDGVPTQQLSQPDYWGDVSPALDHAFAVAAAARVRQREAAMFSGAGKRLSEPGTPQAVRCFVRLKSPAACPPTLAWSAYSELFTVTPWWETGSAKPRVIDMPDPFDRGVLRKLKPNIGFGMPGKLGQLMTPSNLAKLKDGGKPSDSGAIGIDWICGFNIPIITLCALIVLNIFLQLMNLVFWWLPFVKICLPIPRKK